MIPTNNPHSQPSQSLPQIPQKIQKLLQTQIYNPITQTLDIYSNESKNVWQDIINCKDWTQLVRLELNFCNVDSKMLKTVTFKNWPHLKNLSLSSNNNITNKGIRLLINSYMPNLQSLWLVGCNIQNEGAKILPKANWPNLLHLHIGANNIGLDGSRGVVLNNWKKLKLLRVSQNNESPIIVFSYMLNLSIVANIQVSVQSSQQEYLSLITNITYQKSRNQY